MDAAIDVTDQEQSTAASRQAMINLVPPPFLANLWCRTDSDRWQHSNQGPLEASGHAAAILHLLLDRGRSRALASIGCLDLSQSSRNGILPDSAAEQERAEPALVEPAFTVVTPLAALIPSLASKCHGLSELWLRGVCLEPSALLSLACLERLRLLALGNACARLDNAALNAYFQALPQTTWHPIRQRQPFSSDSLSPVRFGSSSSAGPSCESEDGFTAASLTHLEVSTPLCVALGFPPRPAGGWLPRRPTAVASFRLTHCAFDNLASLGCSCET